MFALVSPEKIQLPPDSVVRMPATWQEYQNLCQQRGDGSIPRLKYRNGEVLLMSPLPRHGRDAHLIANIVITLLDNDGQYIAVPAIRDLKQRLEEEIESATGSTPNS
jgi:Uma2 family endonuclease